jgi:D-threo-aldose 1-dehydrogenase
VGTSAESIEAARHELGTTGIEVTRLCVGTSPLGSMPAVYGYEVASEDAVETIKAVLRGPLNFIDTSNAYGNGRSEAAIGLAIAQLGGLPAGYVVATKVDPDPETGVFDGTRVRRSIEESLDRLGLERVDLLYFHDPELIDFSDAMAETGVVPALVRLRDKGICAHIGVAGGPVGLLRQYLETGHFEVLLTHNRWTLLDQSADELLTYAAEAGLGVVNGAPYGGGLLVKGPEASPRYAYTPVSPAMGERSGELHRLCAKYDVPLAAVALQFSLRDPRITSTVVGVSKPERIPANLRLAGIPVPEDLWHEVAALDPLRAEWLY